MISTLSRTWSHFSRITNDTKGWLIAHNFNILDIFSIAILKYLFIIFRNKIDKAINSARTLVFVKA